MVGDLFIGRFLDEFRSIMPIDFLTLEQDRQEGTFWMNMGKSLSEDLYLPTAGVLPPSPNRFGIWNGRFCLTFLAWGLFGCGRAAVAISV